MGVDETGTLTALMALREGLINPKIGEHHGRLGSVPIKGVRLRGDL